MVVRDLSEWVVYGLPYHVETAHQVEILAVHKESLIKKQVILRERLRPHEHEAAGQTWHVHDMVVTGRQKDVPVIFLRSRWKE